MKRVLEMVVTPGTRLWSPHMSVQDALYLLSIAEIDQTSSSVSSYPSANQIAKGGQLPVQCRIFDVCILHASTAEFSIGQFIDDERMTLLETLLVSVRPREVIYRPVCSVLHAPSLPPLPSPYSFPQS